MNTNRIVKECQEFYVNELGNFRCTRPEGHIGPHSGMDPCCDCDNLFDDGDIVDENYPICGCPCHGEPDGGS
jgi:hypothetical protein